MTPHLTLSRIYLFPSTSETQLPLGVVERVLSPIGNGFVQPAIFPSLAAGHNPSNFELPTMNQITGYPEGANRSLVCRICIHRPNYSLFP